MNCNIVMCARRRKRMSSQESNELRPGSSAKVTQRCKMKRVKHFTAVILIFNIIEMTATVIISKHCDMGSTPNVFIEFKP